MKEEAKATEVEVKAPEESNRKTKSLDKIPNDYVLTVIAGRNGQIFFADKERTSLRINFNNQKGEAQEITYEDLKHLMFDKMFFFTSGSLIIEDKKILEKHPELLDNSLSFNLIEDIEWFDTESVDRINTILEKISPFMRQELIKTVAENVKQKKIKNYEAIRLLETKYKIELKDFTE